MGATELSIGGSAGSTDLTPTTRTRRGRQVPGRLGLILDTIVLWCPHMGGTRRQGRGPNGASRPGGPPPGQGGSILGEPSMWVTADLLSWGASVRPPLKRGPM
jgi:hypothetical protein